MSQLFGRDKSVISRHLLDIYKEGELNQKATVAFLATIQLEAVRKVTVKIVQIVARGLKNLRARFQVLVKP